MKTAQQVTPAGGLQPPLTLIVMFIGGKKYECSKS